MLMSRESNDGHHIALCLCHFLTGGPASFFFKVFVTATNDIFKMFFFSFLLRIFDLILLSTEPTYLPLSV